MGDKMYQCMINSGLKPNCTIFGLLFQICGTRKGKVNGEMLMKYYNEMKLKYKLKPNEFEMNVFLQNYVEYMIHNGISVNEQQQFIVNFIQGMRAEQIKLSIFTHKLLKKYNIDLN